MRLDNINIERVNYLKSLNLNNTNMAKRLYRAKESCKLEEYLALCVVKGMENFESKWGF